MLNFLLPMRIKSFKLIDSWNIQIVTTKGVYGGCKYDWYKLPFRPSRRQAGIRRMEKLRDYSMLIRKLRKFSTVDFGKEFKIGTCDVCGCKAVVLATSKMIQACSDDCEHIVKTELVT